MSMTREQNVFLAKKKIVESVFNSAYIEGCNVTFPQTQTILDGAVVSNVSVDDIQTVINLRDAWRFILNSLDSPLTVEYICKVNEHISRNESLEWGVLRTGSIGAGGADWKPLPPIYEEVATKLDTISAISDSVERALEYFCYAVKAQLFWDGNKRTSTLVANQIIVSAGFGILSIGKKQAQNFNDSLLEYYNTDNAEPLKSCLRQCIEVLEI